MQFLPFSRVKFVNLVVTCLKTKFCSIPIILFYMLCMVMVNRLITRSNNIVHEALNFVGMFSECHIEQLCSTV